jgi:hypothetical protein
MERGSDKHTPRIDDQLEGETQSIQRGFPADSRVEDFRRVEEIDPETEEEVLPVAEPLQDGESAEAPEGGEDVEPGEPEAGPEAGGPEEAP